MLGAHLPQINFFIRHPWNFVNYSGYSVSLPGHHILLAWIAKALGYTKIDSTTVPIRLLHAAFGLVFSLVLFMFLYRLRRDDPHENRLWVILALWVSVAPSFYFVQSAVFISTDLPAATIYLVFLYLIAFHSQAIAAITVSATVLVFWRQNYAPVVVLPLLANPDRVLAKSIGPHLLTLIVPGAVLLFYIIQFGGFAPPNSIVEQRTRALNPGRLEFMGLHRRRLSAIDPACVRLFRAGLAHLSHDLQHCGSNCLSLKGTIVAVSVISLLIATIWIAVPSTIEFHSRSLGISRVESQPDWPELGQSFADCFVAWHHRRCIYCSPNALGLKSQ